ncbi:MAG TPA: hypothetical protein VMV09_05750, partial [Candidatus Saccharimonadales bacterium]|nr:hypothetical protein [Candidatus Saccharimonadales bacterium]
LVAAEEELGRGRTQSAGLDSEAGHCPARRATPSERRAGMPSSAPRCSSPSAPSIGAVLFPWVITGWHEGAPNPAALRAVGLVLIGRILAHQTGHLLATFTALL